MEKFCFHRQVGTKGEQEAVELTKKVFKEIGYKEEQIEKEPFRFSDFYSVHLIKLMIVINLFSISLIFVIKNLFPIFTYITILIMLAVVIFILKTARHPEIRGFWENNFGKWISATSVIAKVQAKTLNPSKVGDIIVSAHLDSKSQSYKTIWRVILYSIWLYSEIALGMFYVFFLITVHELFIFSTIFIYIYETGIIISTILLIISNLILFFLKTDNKSVGALDNASGMAIVFELSSYFLFHPLNQFNLWFCQFSAEELGTMGSRTFLDNRESQFEKGKIFQINFDMVSRKGHEKNLIEYIQSYGLMPPKKISPILNKYLKKAAEYENLKIQGFNATVGAHTDSLPFHQRRYDSVDITTRAATKYTHSEQDTIDKVDPLILLEATQIVKRILLMLDEKFSFSHKE